jgi:hypothetical protein
METTPFAQLFVEYAPTFSPYLTRLKQATSLVALVYAAWQFARAVAVRLLEEELQERGHAFEGGVQCPVCGRMMQNKGFKPRTMVTLVGRVTWTRRIRTCSPACVVGQYVLSDEALGIIPFQKTSWEVQRLACRLTVVVPFALARELLSRLTGVHLCTQTLWNWVQDWGGQAMTQLQEDLEALAEGGLPAEESMTAEEHALPLLFGADGVMVPFRPTPGTSQGKTRWREVKVGIFARLSHTVTKTGKPLCRVIRRRVVAVLGDIDALQPRLWGEALRQGILTTACVVWLSDGGRGFWRLFQERFASYAEGILDFYHAAQNLWKGAKAWLDGRTAQAQTWFRTARHRLRHGDADIVLDDITVALDLEDLPAAARQTLSNLSEYLTTHREHIDYARWKEAGIPIGSGMVESACKWLIQQRFKGVGMRWSEDGFNHLLHLRLLWANDRFDTLFGFESYPLT